VINTTLIQSSITKMSIWNHAIYVSKRLCTNSHSSETNEWRSALLNVHERVLDIDFTWIQHLELVPMPDWFHDNRIP